MATQAMTYNPTQMPPSEKKLIRAGQRGDTQALETLFSRYQRPLYQTALRVLGSPEEAEDAVQDGTLSAFRNLKRFEGRSQFSTWLTRTVIHPALMRRRASKAPRNAATANTASIAANSAAARARRRPSAAYEVVLTRPR